MPDFDIDFCVDGRERVIEYVQSRYGDAQVAQIITFGTLLARGVLRDVGRVLEMPYGQVDKLTKLVPQNPANARDPAPGDRGRAAAPGGDRRGAGGRAACWRSRRSSRACTATPRPTPPASSSATGRSRSSCRSTAIRRPACG